MGKIDMFGTEQPLKRAPRDMTNDAFDGGTVEFTGSCAEMSHATTPMGVFDKHVRSGGTREFVGSEVDLNRSPHRGWESFQTPISHNSEGAEAVESSYPHPRGKSR